MGHKNFFLHRTPTHFLAGGGKKKSFTETTTPSHNLERLWTMLKRLDKQDYESSEVQAYPLPPPIRACYVRSRSPEFRPFYMQTNQLLEQDRLKSAQTSKDTALRSYCQSTVRPYRVGASSPQSSLDLDTYSAVSARSSIDVGCGEDENQQRLVGHFSRGRFESRSQARSCSAECCRAAPLRWEQLCIRTALDDADAEAATLSRLRVSMSRMTTSTISERHPRSPPAADSERRSAAQGRPISPFSTAITAGLPSPDQRRLGRHFSRGHFEAIVSRSTARSCSPEGHRVASLEELCIHEDAAGAAWLREQRLTWIRRVRST